MSTENALKAGGGGASGSTFSSFVVAESTEFALECEDVEPILIVDM